MILPETLPSCLKEVGGKWLSSYSVNSRSHSGILKGLEACYSPIGGVTFLNKELILCRGSGVYDYELFHLSEDTLRLYQLGVRDPQYGGMTFDIKETTILLLLSHLLDELQ